MGWFFENLCILLNEKLHAKGYEPSHACNYHMGPGTIIGVINGRAWEFKEVFCVMKNIFAQL